MKKRLRYIFFALTAFFLAANSFGQIKHDFICVDNYGANRLIRVNEFNPAMSWMVEIPEGSRDLQKLEGNRLLVSHGNGAAIYDIKTGKQLKVIAKRYSKIQSARYTKEGFYYLLTIDGKIYKLNSNGEEVNRLAIDKDLDVRLLRFTAGGDFLISCKKPKAVIEVNQKGEITKEIGLKDKGYKALPLENGNYLNTAGDSVKIVEVNIEGEILNFVGGKKEHPSLNLDYCSGWDMLSNGNIVMCNWLGHGKHGTAPHLIEFTDGNKAVWNWEDHKTARQVTNVIFLK